MKKLLSLLVVFTMIFGLMSFSALAEDYQVQNINIVADGDMLGAKGCIMGNKVFMPIRGVAEELDMKVEYNPISDWMPMITLTRGTTSGVPVYYFFELYSLDASYVGGQNVRDFTLTEYPMIVNGMSMMSIRDFCDVMNYDIKWSEQYRTVYITTNSFWARQR